MRAKRRRERAFEGDTNVETKDHEFNKVYARTRSVCCGLSFGAWEKLKRASKSRWYSFCLGFYMSEMTERLQQFNEGNSSKPSPNLSLTSSYSPNGTSFGNPLRFLGSREFHRIFTENQ